jgi:hypothetical protein
MDQTQIRRLIEGLQVLIGERGASGRRALRVDEFDKMFGPASVQTRQQIAQLAEQAAQQGAELGSIVGQIVTINQDIENTLTYVDDEIAGAKSEAASALAQARSDFEGADTALAASITALTATVGSNTAAITNEAATRASSDASLSAQINSVQADFAAESVSLVRDRLLNLQDSANWTRDLGQGALSIVNNDLFGAGKTWRFTVALGQQDGLFTRSDRATWRGIRNSDAFRVEVDFTLQSGTLAGAGIAVDWQNTASTVFRRAIPLSDMLAGPVVAGQAARASAIFRRPTGFSGVFDHTTLRAWANNVAIGDGAKEIRFHRISIWPANADEALVAETAAAVVQEAIARANGDGALAAQISTVSSNVGSLTATVTQQAAALTTLEGYAAATLAFRAQAGSGGATLELVASDNPSGPASTARIDAQNIILNGSVRAAQLATENLITQTAQIANGIVTNVKIADATIQGAKIADATITSAKIENAAITSAKIGDAQITSAKIADTIQSTNFVSGPTGSGWRIQMNGDAEFGTLSLRQNAVSETRHELVTNPTITTAGTHPRAWVNVAQVNYTPFSADTTTLFMAEFQLEMVITTSNGFRNAVYDWELLWRNTVIASGQDNIFAERTSIVNVTTEKTIDVQKFKISPGSTSGQLLLRMRFVEQSGTAPFFSFGVKYAEVASLEFKR